MCIQLHGIVVYILGFTEESTRIQTDAFRYIRTEKQPEKYQHSQQMHIAQHAGMNIHIIASTVNKCSLNVRAVVVKENFCGK